MSAGGAIQSQSSAPESLDRWGFLAAIAFGKHGTIDLTSELEDRSRDVKKSQSCNTPPNPV